MVHVVLRVASHPSCSSFFYLPDSYISLSTSFFLLSNHRCLFANLRIHTHIVPLGDLLARHAAHLITTDWLQACVRHLLLQLLNLEIIQLDLLVLLLELHAQDL